MAKPLRLSDRLARVKPGPHSPEGECDESLVIATPNWGQAVKVTSINPSGVPILYWQVGHLGAETIAVAFSVRGIHFAEDEGVVIGTCPLVADLKWGCGATYHEASIDVSNGTIVTLTASTLQVNVRFLDAEGTPQATFVEAHATLTYGQDPNPAQPTRTFPSSLLESEGPALQITIPPFSKGFALYSPDPTVWEEGNLTVEIINSTGLAEVVSTLDGSEVECAQFTCCGYPLPGHARSLRITSLLEEVRITPMFFLHL